MDKTILDYAMDYVYEKGYSVIPLRPRDKRPVAKWEEYQKRKATKDELKKWFYRTDNNIGIVTGAISDLSVVDLDGKDAVDFMTSEGRELPITPIVKTGKEYGYHLYHKFNEALRNFQARMNLPHIDLRSEGGYVVAPPSIHPSGKPYQWFNESAPCLPVPDWFLKIALNANAFKNTSVLQDSNTSTPVLNSNIDAIFSNGRRDTDLFHVASRMVRGGLETEYIQKVLEILVNSWGEHDPKWCQDKIKSAIKRSETTDRNITQELRDYISITSGAFNVTNASQAITFHNKASIRTILHRLSTGEGRIIEPDKVRGDGWFRRIENDLAEIDFKNAKGDFLDIKYPFGIEKWFKTAPKNIIVIAGEPDAGKTAFLLNFAALNNWNSMGITYFSSEMGEFELKTRLMNFSRPTINGWRMQVFERSADFADVIRPDGINIIDFLELHDEFYKVGFFMKQIFDKLDKGIALIAIQKNPGKDQGLGGMRSIEKARLAVNMERGGRLIIEKAKNWATENNPRGLCVNYKLVGGSDFRITEDWKYADGIRSITNHNIEPDEPWQNQF